MIPLLVFGEGIDLSRISLTEKETREMSNHMNMGRYLSANGELWGRSLNNDIFRAKVVSEKMRLKLEESTVLLSNTVSVFYCTNEGSVFCVLEAGGSEPEGIIAISMTDNSIQRLYNGCVGFLQLVGGHLYFTDEEHHLKRMGTKGQNLETVLDRAIFYPYMLEENLLLFQDDADGEKLHALDLTAGTEETLLDCRTYCYIISGNDLYYCYCNPDEEGCRLGRLHLTDRSNESFQFYCGDSFFIDGDQIIFADDSSEKLTSNFAKHKNVRNYATTRQSYLYSDGENYVRYGWKNSSNVITKMSLFPCGRTSGGTNLTLE